MNVCACFERHGNYLRKHLLHFFGVKAELLHLCYHHVKLSTLELAQALSMEGFSLNHDSPRLNSFDISSLNVHSTEGGFVWGSEKSKSFSIFKMSRIFE